MDQAIEANGQVLLGIHLNSLSLQERERCFADIHGVAEQIPEDEVLLEKKLEELQAQLGKIPQKAAYDLAIAQNRGYVESRQFRLKFLRADDLDPAKAASRMVLFMEKILNLFGPEMLGKPLAFNDLDVEDRKVLRAGLMQFLPIRDRSGRQVFCNFANMFPKCYTNGINLVGNFEPSIASARFRLSSF